jgi:hypothetical protein
LSICRSRSTDLIQSGEIISPPINALAPGQENQALQIAQVNRASAGDHDLLARQDEPETSDGLEDLQRGSGGWSAKGSRQSD